MSAEWDLVVRLTRGEERLLDDPPGLLLPEGRRWLSVSAGELDLDDRTTLATLTGVPATHLVTYRLEHLDDEDATTAVYRAVLVSAAHLLRQLENTGVLLEDEEPVLLGSGRSVIGNSSWQGWTTPGLREELADVVQEARAVHLPLRA